ncbi:BZ3500_MvSof-1268-A1-R1_Chr8-1g09961 [Microbotryum saponariae]|uniref:BZ3500_MvSof-1268-A1-R1_Chr8-1g09961 protein n=1 Tax=Microbotryum saponariae TaxID=289078 RepID=A0A2X0NQZ2_9BASI|nr:BZ3500_MvSof-1268-A1-R1_Chr8-1g09961 [Microbotryum saponariae]SDA08247.1 BZ3501_MvSof-1269-A2-R1_Chr8-1g09684 [Microbotryum saponariae]
MPQGSIRLIGTLNAIEQQDPLETRKVWDDVSQALLRKDFSTAGKNKQALEQHQRDKAEGRKKSGEVYTPRFFQPEAEGDAWDGRPTLTQEGSEAIEKEFKAEYPKPDVKEVAAAAAV